MSDYPVITIHITLEAANDPVFDTAPARSSSNESECNLWSKCNDPLCFSAGCRTDVFRPKEEEKS